MKEKSKSGALISIIVPVYNESEGIVWLHNELSTALSKLSDYSFEIVYVNDGSNDDSLAKIRQLAPKSGFVIKIVDLSRNFGKESALSAGFAATEGKAVICVDADGQYPVSYISQFLEKWQNGAEVVVGIRGKNHKEGFVKRYGSKAFYALFNKVTGSNMVPKSTDFRLLDRIVVDEFNKLTERNRVTRGLIDWLGYKQDYIYFDAPPRKFGNATYTFNKLVQLALNTFISLSSVPLFLAGYIGIFCIFIGISMGIFIAVEQFILGDPMQLAISGTAMLGILIVFLVGVILAAQGLIGLYIARVLNESQGRPVYIVRSTTVIKH